MDCFKNSGIYVGSAYEEIWESRELPVKNLLIYPLKDDMPHVLGIWKCAFQSGW